MRVLIAHLGARVAVTATPRRPALSRRLNSVEVYDPHKNAWTFMAPMSSKRWGPAAVVVTAGGRDKLFVVGGYDGINYLNSVEVYD